MQNLPAFIEVARTLSFTQAADNLNLVSSTLSRRIAQLEHDLGVQLLLRSTRSVELTEAGRELYERGLAIMEQAQAARDAITSSRLSMSGPVRVSIHEDAYFGFLQGSLTEFADRYPEIRLEISFCEHQVNLMTEPYDVDFRIGPLPDSSLRARKILPITRALYATPKLFHRVGMPREPADLARMPCISSAYDGHRWKLQNGDKIIEVPVQPAYCFGSDALIFEFISRGYGIGFLTHNELHAMSEKSGLIVKVLPEWQSPPRDLFLLLRPGPVARRVRVFIDFVQEIADRILADNESA